MCEHLRRVAPDEGNRLDMDESRQVDQRQMDAAERMNLKGVGETASSPPFKRARLGNPLHGEHEKTGKDETELVMKIRGSFSSSTILGKLRSLCFFETSSPDPYEESRRDSVINMGPIRTLVH